MTQRPYEPGTTAASQGVPDFLPMIREDMEVYDANGDHIGEVEWVYMGTSSPTATEAGHGAATADDPRMGEQDTLWNIVTSAFRDDDLPETLRNRLLHSGFVRIEADGWFSSDRYVLPEQIAGVSSDGVHLNVTRESLIKD